MGGVSGMSASVPVRFIFNSPLHPEQSPNCFIPFSLIFFFMVSNSTRNFPWPAAVIYDTEGQVQIVLSAILGVNKIIYSVKFVYSFKNCHHMAIWLCDKYYLCHSNLMS